MSLPEKIPTMVLLNYIISYAVIIPFAVLFLVYPVCLQFSGEKEMKKL